MFESITIKINNPSNPLDIGYLAECLLFYDKTNLLIDKESLTNLFRLCGVDEIYELIQRGYLSIQTRANILGAGQREDTFFVDLFSATNVDKHRETFYEAFLGLYGKQGKARRNSQKFINCTSAYVCDNKVVKDIKDSINDKALIKQIINDFICQIGLEKDVIGEHWFYEFFPIDNYSFKHKTNLNLEYIKNVAKAKQFHFDFSPTSLLLNLSESLGDVYLSEFNKSEIFTTPLNSQIINLKFENLFNKAKINKEQISRFQKMALPTYKNIESVINEGAKTYSDLIRLIDKAEKFRKWKNEIKNESEFIEEYSKAIATESWVDKMPTKVGRFVIFEGVGILLDVLGAGGIGTAVATTLGTADSFLLDSLIKKWKPNQFVKGDYKKFVK